MSSPNFPASSFTHWQVNFFSDFETKWGAALTELFLRGNSNLIKQYPELAEALDKNDYPAIIRKLSQE